MSDLPPTTDPIPWSGLSAERQLQLREAYGRDPACQTGTCSLDDKIARFADWLAARGIRFGAEDLPGRR
ncbi:hypothetical protein [Pseudodonghicola flavimaris]|uniref:Uncharacterized protein n=1 Tax=Pseudodonghicola flavimaris TaxID=3050036 RepID=A0ABT7F6V0_9RHOB|nr:hypothetical protein [Pseudodonghicola flavimaris]MDK3020340.1 hypothetical protein [Pseudodonghicola flavimaris]